MFADDQGAAEGGVRGAVKHLLESCSGFLAAKLELVGIELQEEKRRVIELVALASVAMLFAVLALTVLTFTLIAAFWDTDYRMASLIGITLVYLAISAAFFACLRRKVSMAPGMFDTTLEELKKDAEWIKRHL